MRWTTFSSARSRRNRRAEGDPPSLRVNDAFEKFAGRLFSPSEAPTSFDNFCRSWKVDDGRATIRINRRDSGAGGRKYTRAIRRKKCRKGWRGSTRNGWNFKVHEIHDRFSSQRAHLTPFAPRNRRLWDQLYSFIPLRLNRRC